MVEIRDPCSVISFSTLLRVETLKSYRRKYNQQREDHQYLKICLMNTPCRYPHCKMSEYQAEGGESHHGVDRVKRYNLFDISYFVHPAGELKSTKKEKF